MRFVALLSVWVGPDLGYQVQYSEQNRSVWMAKPSSIRSTDILVDVARQRFGSE